MTEPSPEAVELIRAEVSRRRGACYCNVDPHCSVCREAEEVVAIARPALRAVEQRTRLETLERAAVIVAAAPTAIVTYDYRLSEDGVGVRVYGAVNRSEACKAIRFEIASLQPRARQCVNEGDSCCNHGPEDDAPAEPREAPKAEEPKPREDDQPTEADRELLKAIKASLEWAAPQPGPEEGR